MREGGREGGWITPVRYFTDSILVCSDALTGLVICVGAGV